MTLSGMSDLAQMTDNLSFMKDFKPLNQAETQAIKNVCEVLSMGGKEIFEKFGVRFEFETLTEKIINRSGTDICPMEKTVLN